MLFDLGGVLVRLGGVASMGEMAGLASEDEVWRRWLACRWVRDFERGRCTAEEFAQGVVLDWGLRVDPDDFLARFAVWPEGLLPGAIDLVEEVKGVRPVGCLSNSNAVHWAEQARWFGPVFDAAFLSHEMDLIKPDRDVFDHVAAALSLDPGAILFLDDNAPNVEAAVEAGFQAAVARDPVDARAVLEHFGVLGPRPARVTTVPSGQRNSRPSNPPDVRHWSM